MTHEANTYSIQRHIAACIRKQQKPIIVIQGPLGSGKTTLLRHLFPHISYVDCTDAQVRKCVSTHKESSGFFAQYSRGAIFDEVQKTPKVLDAFKHMSITHLASRSWVLIGSEAFSIDLPCGAESVHYHLFPLSRTEMEEHSLEYSLDGKKDSIEELVFRGSFPSVLAKRQARYFSDYVDQFVKHNREMYDYLGEHGQDIFYDFLRLCAGRTATIIDPSLLANDCGVAENTIMKWLEVMRLHFWMYAVPALDVPAGKMKTPVYKYYFVDTGLLCWLLSIPSPKDLVRYPIRERIFQTWLMGDIIKTRVSLGMSMDDIFYYYHRHPKSDVFVIKDTNGVHITLIDARYNRTGKVEFFEGLSVAEKRLSKHYSTQAMVFYAGDRFFRFQGKVLLSYADTHKLPWESIESLELDSIRDPQFTAS